jgi:hypothetical protein
MLGRVMRIRTAILSSILLAGCGGALGGGGGGGDGGGTGEPLSPRDDPAELVFCRDRTGTFSDAQIRRAAANGLGDDRVLDRTGIERDVRIAPDGVRIAFVRERRNNAPQSRELFVGTVDGSAAELRLTVDEATDEDPTWAPDGARIVFSSDRFGGRPLLLRIDPAGQAAAPLYDDGSEQRHPDWSWTDGRIAFARRSGNGPSEIWVVDADGRVAAPVTDGGPAGTDRDPAWAPDGRSIVFVREAFGGGSHLSRVDLRSGVVDDLSPADGTWTDPRWSPRGDRLFVVGDRPAHGILGPRLWTMRPDGSDRFLLFGDERYRHLGVDVLPGIRPAPSGTAEWIAADLEQARISNSLGSASRGRTDFVLAADGRGFGITTVAQTGREIAGLELEVRLPVLDPRDVRAVEFQVVAAVADPTPGSLLRLALRNHVARRNDTVVELTPTGTSSQTFGFTVAGLQHVDRGGHVRLGVLVDNPGDTPTELLIDAILVRVQRPAADPTLR